MVCYRENKFVPGGAVTVPIEVGVRVAQVPPSGGLAGRHFPARRNGGRAGGLPLYSGTAWPGLWSHCARRLCGLWSPAMGYRKPHQSTGDGGELCAGRF